MLLVAFLLHCCWSGRVSAQKGEHPDYGDQWIWKIYSFCPPRWKNKSAHRIPLGGDSFVPVLASRHPGSEARLAVIIIPGVYRESEGMMKWMEEHVLGDRNHHDSASTLLVAPVFPGVPCSAKKWNNGPSSLHSPVWSIGNYWVRPTRWAFGGFDDDNKTTSLEVLDRVVRWVEENYPEVARISVVGNSAGGQLVHRWSVVSELGVDGKSPNGRVALRSIVSEPATWLYLNNQRPSISCTPNTDTGPHFRCSTYPSVTDIGHQNSSQDNCNQTFNRWPVGLGDVLDSEPATVADCGQDGMYYCMGVEVKKYILTTSGDISLGQLHRRWRTKDVRFMIGAWDTYSCYKYACSEICASMIQGCNRLQRFTNYMEYLRQIFPGYEPAFYIYKGGHNWHRIFKNEQFLHWILDPAENMEAYISTIDSWAAPGQWLILTNALLVMALIAAMVVMYVSWSSSSFEMLVGRWCDHRGLKTTLLS